MYDETAAKSPTEDPATRAHRLLDELASELQHRAKVIDGQIERLSGERDSIWQVLARINPPAPQAIRAVAGGPQMPPPTPYELSGNASVPYKF